MKPHNLCLVLPANNTLVCCDDILRGTTHYHVSWYFTCRWSSNLPGVAIKMFTPLHNFSASVLRLAPPITIPSVWWWYLSSSLATPYVCSDSSLVGEIPTTPVPICQDTSVLQQYYKVTSKYNVYNNCYTTDHFVGEISTCTSALQLVWEKLMFFHFQSLLLPSSP